MLDERSDLPNAIALNSMLFNTARLIGPALAGVLTVALNEGLCFGVNALSYLAVILALLAMRLPPHPPKLPGAGNVWISLAQGFRYTFGFPPIRDILLLLSLTSLMGMHMVLMPVFAKDILHGDPRTYGSLVSFVGAGALLGALYLASRRSVVGLDRIIGLGPILMGLCAIVFAYFAASVGITAHPTAATTVALGRPWIAVPMHLPAWTTLPISWALMAGCGFAIMVQMASSNTLLQTVIEDEKRGRVMSFYALSFMGMAPFCSLMAGSLAQHIGAPNTVAIGSLAMIIGALLYLSRLGARRVQLQPTYERLGIVPRRAK
jgi:MFS family permease